MIEHGFKIYNEARTQPFGSYIARRTEVNGSRTTHPMISGSTRRLTGPSHSDHINAIKNVFRDHVQQHLPDGVDSAVQPNPPDGVDSPDAGQLAINKYVITNNTARRDGLWLHLVLILLTLSEHRGMQAGRRMFIRGRARVVIYIYIHLDMCVHI